MHDCISGKCKTECFFDNQIKTVTAWLGNSDSSTIFIRHCTFRCSFITALQNSLSGKKNSIPWKTVKSTGTVLYSKR